MAGPADSDARLVRFGTFDLSLETWELRNKGTRVKIEGQPLRLLALLLSRPGELVTREELRQKLWPDDTFVDFDHGINAAVKRLRQVLRDSAANPRFIETLPRRGYRFIYPVNDGIPDAARPVPLAPRTMIWPGLGIIAALGVLAASTAGWLRDGFLHTGLRFPVTSVAVLPFTNLTGDTDQEYLADGITDDLTTELARIRQLHVPSVTSSMSYKSTRKPLPEIAKNLKTIEAFVEGSVQRSGQRLLINVQLLHGTTDRHLWSWRYECDDAARQPLMHQIARDLIREMKVPLTSDQQARLGTPRSLSPEAYNAYQRGRYHQNRGTDADRRRAQQFYEKAIEIDRSFAAAYAQLALQFAHGGAYLIGGSQESRVQARQMADRALKLDSTLAEPHAALAWVEMSDWDWRSAEEHFRQAIDLNPNLAVARVWYAQYLNTMGRTAEAVEQAEIAIRLAPLTGSSISHAAQIYVRVGRLDDAIATYRRVLELEPEYWFGHHALGEAYLLRGMYPQAIKELELAIALRGGDTANTKGLLARACVKAGQVERAKQIAADFERQAATKQIPAYGPTQAYLALGEHERALKWLEQAYERRGELMWMLNQEWFDPLRSDPRFLDLVRRVGLPSKEARAAAPTTPSAR